MTYRSSEMDRFRNLSLDDDHRSYRFGRTPHSGVHRSGMTHLKRFAVPARLARNHVRGFFAAIRVALVADKMRRVGHEPAFRRVAAGRAPEARPDRTRT